MEMRVSIYEIGMDPVFGFDTKIAEFHWRVDACDFAEWLSASCQARIEVHDLKTGKVLSAFQHGSQMISVADLTPKDFF